MINPTKFMKVYAAVLSAWKTRARHFFSQGFYNLVKSLNILDQILVFFAGYRFLQLIVILSYQVWLHRCWSPRFRMSIQNRWAAKAVENSLRKTNFNICCLVLQCCQGTWPQTSKCDKSYGSEENCYGATQRWGWGRQTDSTDIY